MGPQMTCTKCGKRGSMYAGAFHRAGLVRGTVGMPKYDWTCRTCLDSNRQPKQEVTKEAVDDAPF